MASPRPVSAVYPLSFGALIVAFHNVWSGLPMVLTVIGWAQVAKGLLRFVAPQMSLRAYERVAHERAGQLRIAGPSPSPLRRSWATRCFARTEVRGKGTAARMTALAGDVQNEPRRCSYAVMGMSIAAAIAACQPAVQPATAPATEEIPVGEMPVDVVAGDLDGDGRPDLVSADARGRILTIRLQRAGAWVPAPGPTPTLPIEPHLVALGDLDRDGDLDLLATGHDSGAVFAWLGDGSGGFAPAPGSPVTVFAGAPHNHGLAAGDLDGDGDADVVVADQDARAAGVLLAGAEGRLVPSLASPIALGASPYTPALGDMDGDGILDLVVPLIGGEAVTVLLGDGSGGFAPASGSPLRTARPRPYAVMLGDLDRDGAIDIVATHDDSGEVSVLLGDGSGRLRAAPGPPVSFGLRLWRGMLADVDGDGALDLVAAGSGSLVMARGDGRGGLGRPSRQPAGGWVAIAAELDGDGRLELVAPDPDASLLRIWRP